MALGACKEVINGEARRLLGRAIEAGEQFESLLSRADAVQRAKREELAGRAIEIDNAIMAGGSLVVACDAYDALNLDLATAIDQVTP